MASIPQILQIENDNYERIHLFREGLFLRAYQHSAFLFLNNVKDFKVVKKHYKAAGCEVVIIGFPSSLLESLFPKESIEQVDEWHFSVPCGQLFDKNDYQKWFDSVELLPEKPRQKKELPQLFAPTVQVPDRVARPTDVHRAPEVDLSHGRVLRELEAFSIENSTPMECMMFLSKLKSELKKQIVGGI